MIGADEVGRILESNLVFLFGIGERLRQVIYFLAGICSAATNRGSQGEKRERGHRGHPAACIIVRFI